MLYLESPFHREPCLDGLLGELRPARGIVIYVASVAALWGEAEPFTFREHTDNDRGRIDPLRA